MKRITIAIAVMCVFAVVAFGQQAQQSAVQQNNEGAPAAGPVAKWDTMVYDMGEVPFMQSRQAEFKLTNAGTQPLVITSARASCGCTNLKYTQEPIMPGDTSTMSVTFNGSGNGAFRKTITVQTNAAATQTVLQISGTVVKAE